MGYPRNRCRAQRLCRYPSSLYLHFACFLHAILHVLVHECDVFTKQLLLEAKTGAVPRYELQLIYPQLNTLAQKCSCNSVGGIVSLHRRDACRRICKSQESTKSGEKRFLLLTICFSVPQKVVL